MIELLGNDRVSTVVRGIQESITCFDKVQLREQFYFENHESRPTNNGWAFWFLKPGDDPNRE